VKLVVLCKPVGARRPVIDRQSRLLQSSQSFHISPLDRLACRLAQELRGPGDEVIALSAGPPQVEGFGDALAKLGVDRVCLVGHPVLMDADYFALAHTLAAALRHTGYDLVLAGETSPDDERAAVPAATAGLLDVPHLGAVREARWVSPDSAAAPVADGAAASEPAARVLRVERTLTAERLAARLTLPALITVSPEVQLPATAPPSRPTPPPVESYDLDVLGVQLQDVSPRTKVVSHAAARRAPRRGGAELMSDAPSLVAALRRERLI
jgi:electron transfer flavoprotein beta subunit